MLEHDGEGARISDIAAVLGVTKASACTAMKALQSKKLIDRDAYRLVCLTIKGEVQAILAIHKNTIIRNFFVEVLDINKEITSKDACAIEHVISMETLCALCRCLHKSECLHSCNWFPKQNLIAKYYET